jgi:hypothetical protein
MARTGLFHSLSPCIENVIRHQEPLTSPHFIGLSANQGASATQQAYQHFMWFQLQERRRSSPQLPPDAAETPIATDRILAINGRGLECGSQ